MTPELAEQLRKECTAAWRSSVQALRAVDAAKRALADAEFSSADANGKYQALRRTLEAYGIEQEKISNE